MERYVEPDDKVAVTTDGDKHPVRSNGALPASPAQSRPNQEVIEQAPGSLVGPMID